MEKLVLFITLIVFSFARAGLNDGLVAYYQLNNNAADSSGGSHPGTIYGNPDWSSQGHIDGSIDMDGDGDYVLIAGYPGITGSGTRACSAWIRTSNVSSFNHAIVSWGNGSTTDQNWVMGLFTDGTIGVSTYSRHIKGLTSIADGAWHHVAAVLPEGMTTVGQVQLYVDGVLLTQQQTFSNYPSHQINTSSGNVVIGGYNLDGVYRSFFDGNIDDVRIYDRTLSPDEVMQIYTIPEPCTLLLLGLGGLILRRRQRGL